MSKIRFEIFKKLFLLIVIIISSSCEKGTAKGSCIEADSFGGFSTVVNAYRQEASGNYNHDFDSNGNYTEEGGQVVSWEDTYLTYNGEELIIKISGDIKPWIFSSEDDENRYCEVCAEHSDVAGCICFDEEFDTKGCIKNDSLNPKEFSYRAINRIDANGVRSNPDMEYVCKYRAGLNAYIGVFSASNSSSPERLYHLFSTERVCDVARNSEGRCLDDKGKDVTKYIFRSNGPLVKSSDANGNPTEWHKNGEKLKVLFADRWYLDNSGQYFLEFLSGVNVADSSGLLEMIVKTVEDLILGDPKELYIKDAGTDQASESSTFHSDGGLLKVMYNNIVTDSGFAGSVTLLLCIYIVVFGVSVLAGVIEMDRKEIMKRVVKIALVIMFTNPASWNMYNDYVVKFFKGGTDEVVAMMVNLSNEYRDVNSSTIECNRYIGADDRNATRFSCIDGTIKKFFSSVVTKKILGLFFYNGYGFILIILIYFLILGFIFVMLYAASIYIINLLKIIFVLSFGPVFFCFSLFEKTKSLFTNWIKFLVGRSIEIIILFTAVYFFWHLIDRKFSELLHYQVCYFQKWFIPRILPFPTLVLQANDVNRSFGDWINQIIGIGALLFMTYLVIKGMSQVAASLAAFGGSDKGGGPKDDKGQASGSSSFSMASSMMKGLSDLTQSGVKTAFTSKYGINKAISYGVQGATSLARTTGVNKVTNSIGKAIPFRGPRTRWRDNIIDSAIKMAQKEASGKGIEGKEADSFVRNRTMELLMKQKEGYVVQGQSLSKMKTIDGQGNKFRMLGIDNEAILKRLDKKLVEEPLKNQIQKQAAAIKEKMGSNVPLGQEMRQMLNDSVQKWAEQNVVASSDKVANYLQNMKGLVKNNAALSTKEAYKLTKDNKEFQSKFMQDLQNEQFANSHKRQIAWKRGNLSGIASELKRFGHSFTREVGHNPKLAQENFARKMARKQDIGFWKKDDNGNKTWIPRIEKLNPLRYNKFLDLESQRIIRSKPVQVINNGFRLLAAPFTIFPAMVVGNPLWFIAKLAVFTANKVGINKLIGEGKKIKSPEHFKMPESFMPFKPDPKTVLPKIDQKFGEKFGIKDMQRSEALSFIKNAQVKNQNDIGIEARKASHLMKKFVNKITRDQEKDIIKEERGDYNKYNLLKGPNREAGDRYRRFGPSQKISEALVRIDQEFQDSIKQKDDKSLIEKAAERNAILRARGIKGDRTPERIAKLLADENKEKLNKILKDQNKSPSQKIDELNQFKKERTTILSPNLTEEQVNKLNSTKHQDLSDRKDGVSDDDFRKSVELENEKVKNDSQYTFQNAFKTHLQSEFELDEAIEKLQKDQLDLTGDFKEINRYLHTIDEGDENEIEQNQSSIAPDLNDQQNQPVLIYGHAFGNPDDQEELDASLHDQDNEGESDAVDEVRRDKDVKNKSDIQSSLTLTSKDSSDLASLKNDKKDTDEKDGLQPDGKAEAERLKTNEERQKQQSELAAKKQKQKQNLQSQIAKNNEEISSLEKSKTSDNSAMIDAKIKSLQDQNSSLEIQIKILD